MDWPTKTIGKLGRIVTGKTPSSERPDEFGSEYPFVTPSDMAFGIRTVSTERCLSEKGREKHQRILLPKKTVCVVCIGATVGKSCLTHTESFSNQQVNSIVVDTQENDPDFIYYYSTLLRPTLEAYAGGAATPIVNKSSFSSIRLKVPPLAYQKKAAVILSAYDDLIENNKHRIALLENMAEEIYREWFVRYRFPGYQTAEFEKGIPKRWKKKRFDEFCVLKRGYDLPDSDVVEGEYPVLASTSVKTFHNQFKVKPPVITTGRSGSLGTVLYVSKEAWPLNTTLYVKDFMGNSPYLIYYTLKQMTLENYNAGAGVPTLNRNHLGALKLPVPDEAIQAKFSDIIGPIFKQIDALSELNEKLESTKELLLPRLISGKLSLADLSIQFPPSMSEDEAA